MVVPVHQILEDPELHRARMGCTRTSLLKFFFAVLALFAVRLSAFSRSMNDQLSFEQNKPITILRTLYVAYNYPLLSDACAADSHTYPDHHV